MMKKAYLYIFSILAIIFGFVSLIISCVSMHSASLDFGNVAVWAQDSVLHYNSNYNAGSYIIAFLIIFAIVFLLFVVMFPLLIKKRNYILIIFLLTAFITFIISLIPCIYFIYLDFNFGLNGIAIIDIDIYSMIIGVFGLCFSLGTFVMIILNMKKTTFKYDPVVIHFYRH